MLNTSPQRRYEILKRPGVSPGRACYEVFELGYLPPSPKEKEERVLDWFFFKRYRIPRFHAIELEKKGNLKAHEQLIRAKDECWRLFHGHGRQLPRFKVSLIHSDLLELGLPHGILKLTADELAGCFDEVCPCGKSHNADALKKQRARVVKDVNKASELSSKYRSATPGRKRFAVYGSDGFIAKPYELRDGMRYVELTRMETGLEYVIYEDSDVDVFKEESFESFQQSLSRLAAMFFVPNYHDIFKMFFP